MRFGKFDIYVVRECQFKLDGGAMFGVVPKTLWGKVSPADDENRILLACNLFVIDTGDAKVMVDAGMGPRWSDKERQRYAISSLVDHREALASIGLKNEDIDAIVISHMHFDHLGGAVLEAAGKLVPAYPNARVFVQKGEYELARRVNARGRASYREEDIAPLEQAGKLEIIDGDSEILPGVRAVVTGGHTSHHQIVTVESEGKKAVFFADIVPTCCHISPPWVMGYDHFPLESCEVKDRFLTQAAQEGWLVVFDHEIGVPWGYVNKDEQGRFTWTPLPADTLAPAQLARP